VANPSPNNLHLIWRCYSYLKPYWHIVLGAYVSVLGTTALSLIVPQVIRTAIDNGIHAQDSATLTNAVLMLLGLSLLRGVLTFTQGSWVETASQSVAFDLRNAIQRKLTLLSFAFLAHSETGELLSRAIQDVERIRALTGRATLRILTGSVLLVTTAITLLWMNPRLALLAMCTMPLLAWRALEFGKLARPLSLAVQRQLATLTTRIEQNLRGARVVKAFAQEHAEIERYDRENERWFDLSAQSVHLQAVHAPLLNLIANVGTVFILWYGGLLVIQQQLTLGELVAFTTYLAQLVNPVRLLGNMIPILAMGAASSERIFEILDTVPDVRDAPNAQPLAAIQGRVQFENVSFKYGKRQIILQDIQLDAQPGQVIALLGATGSGKSTLISLLPRFYDPTSGRILIDGHDLREVTLNSLRGQVGIVLQETILFAATIRENIAFGRPDASQDEIERAAKIAQAHDFISQLPEGYDTDVGERGVTLSGGQKQRLAIARAMLINPRILILDDATASVDTETERQIQRALDELMRGRTTFVIAHRLSTLKRADVILVLELGRIVARGTHDELLHSSELYAEIYRRQFQEEIPAE
jgi:ABC-type multidrug transport system fused ATPase/permease subunit